MARRDRLDKLFKALTRWTLAATMPVFLLLVVAPGDVLQVFGSEFVGRTRRRLLIILAGQFINVATGSVGFVLIMVGRTGWDLVVYAASLALNLGLAFWLCPTLRDGGGRDRERRHLRALQVGPPGPRQAVRRHPALRPDLRQTDRRPRWPPWRVMCAGPCGRHRRLGPRPGADDAGRAGRLSRASTWSWGSPTRSAGGPGWS